jgi:biotin transport system ATP-binding protein
MLNLPKKRSMSVPPKSDKYLRCDFDHPEFPGLLRGESSMIRLEDLSYRYDSEAPYILRSLNLLFTEGSHTVLIGPNGCGKTTLIKHLNALLFPTSGSVTVDGMKTTDSSAIREIRRRVGMVFQNPECQIIGMTVEEDVAFGPGNLALPQSEIRRRVDDCLKMVGMSGLEKRVPHTLSGGEKRLLSIAGVLAMAPQYIAFDEPTAYLDQAGRLRVLSIIQRLHQEGIAIIHITHDLRDITGADRLVVMDRGGVLIEGPPAEVFSRSELLVSAGLDIPSGRRS